MKNIPAVTAVLVALCLLGYGFELAMGVNWLNPDSQSLIGVGANFGPTTIGKSQYWRLLSSIFLHQGIVHIALNMYVLVGFGRLAEAALGRFRFLFIFIFSGLVGGLVSILANPITTSVGCSGANVGIIGAFMLSSWFKHADQSIRLTRPQMLLLLVFLIYSLLLGLTTSYIDNSAHVGGFFAGVLASALLTHHVSSRAYIFSSNPAKAIALLTILPILAVIDSRRIENNPEVQCCVVHMEAIALLKEKKYFHGIEKLDDAHKLMPEDTSVLSDRAKALTEIGQYDKAIADIDKVAEKHPKDPFPLMTKAGIYHKQRHDDEAVAEMDKILSMKKPSGLFGFISQFQGLFNKSKAEEEANFYNNRAWFKLAKGDVDGAMEDCNQSLKLNRGSSTAYDTRSIAYYLQGKYDLADQDLIKAIRQNKDDGAFYYHRALILLALGKPDDAKVALAKFQKLDYKPEAWEPKLTLPN